MERDQQPHPIQILKVIKRVRESAPEIAEIYSRGACVKFSMILLEIWPEGSILYDEDHAIFEFGGACYDINGIARRTDRHVPLEELGLLRAYELMK